MKLLAVRSALIVTFAILLTACEEPKIPVTQEISQKISSIDHFAYVMQDELAITVSQTNPGNTGALGAIIAGVIDAGRQNSAEKKSKPIFDAIGDFDFRQTLLTNLNNTTSQSGYQVNNSLENLSDKEKKSGVLSRSTASAVMFSDVQYALESGGNFTISANVELYPNNAGLNALVKKPNSADPVSKGNRLYQNTFTFKRQAVYAENILDTLNEGAQNIAQQIMQDISAPS